MMTPPIILSHQAAFVQPTQCLRPPPHRCPPTSTTTMRHPPTFRQNIPPDHDRQWAIHRRDVHLFMDPRRRGRPSFTNDSIKKPSSPLKEYTTEQQLLDLVLVPNDNSLAFYATLLLLLAITILPTGTDMTAILMYAALAFLGRTFILDDEDEDDDDDGSMSSPPIYPFAFLAALLTAGILSPWNPEAMELSYNDNVPLLLFVGLGLIGWFQNTMQSDVSNSDGTKYHVGVDEEDNDSSLPYPLEQQQQQLMKMWDDDFQKQMESGDSDGKQK